MQMIQKLEKTSLWAEQCLDRVNSGHFSSPVLPDNELYIYQKDLVNDLKLVYDSLCSTGNEITADGRLTDIIRNASAFGLTLVPLDIRQESDRHMEALDCITRYLGLGRYADWDEETKINWLVQQLGSMRPLIRPGDWELHPEIFTPTAIDTLGTFSVITEQYEGSLGAYVISQATSASDVLAVYVLQKDAGVKKPLRVVPLFETLNDLNMATSTMKKLYSLPTFMGIILGRQEIMIGYSDSAKDAGRLAASWAQYETQEKLAALSRQHNVEVTFFHGKGGTVGRGGNPATFQAILAHAPDTINGRFRVTEQGEMINQNFGHGDRAERTLDIYTAAVLAEKLIQRPKPTEEWRAIMTRLSDISCDSYRRIVRGDSRFVPYFRSATPEIELTKLNIGSRPAKRKAGGGVESLRAIPWNFAWTQTRRNLPTWLGVGDAVNEVLASNDKETLRHMYENWGSFQTTIDLVEMVLAKSEPAIAQHYEKVLVKEVEAQELGKEIRDLHLAAEEAVLSLTGHETLTEGKRMLTRALQVRNPYVDCLNVLQAETLKRLRESEDGKEDPFLHDALMTSITGIANGMGNTG
jgi:phosphoenolpyruvate carboxylase